MNCRQIAKIMEIHHSVVHRSLHNEGIDTARRMDPRAKQAVKLRSETNLTLKQISVHLDALYQTVVTWCHGVQRAGSDTSRKKII